MKVLMGAAAALLVACFSPPVQAETIEFVGPHPVEPGLLKGMCEIEGPHVHAYAPHRKMLYVKVGPAYSFVGDPTEFEEQAARHAYYGHHPLFWIDLSVVEDAAPLHEYCYISGPHYHWQKPPEVGFRLKGGVYWYVKAHPRWYVPRRKRHRILDGYYAKVSVSRPVVRVAPPSGFVGIVLGARGGVHVGGGVGMGVRVGPGAVHVRRPRVDIDINIPIPSVGVVIGDGRGRAYRRGRVIRRGPRFRRRRREYDDDDKDRGRGKKWRKHKYRDRDKDKDKDRYRERGHGKRKGKRRWE